MNEAIPFPPLHQFRRRGEFVAYLLAAFPNAPEVLYVAAAGSFELYTKEVACIRGASYE